MINKVGSVFSGIGGLDLGIEAAGIGRTVYQVELQEFQRRVLRKHWPRAVQHDDITNVGASRSNKVPVADVIVGGFPCTGFSRAGQGAGLRNPASALWFQMLRLIDEQRLGAVVIENVMSLLQPRFEQDRLIIYSGLQQLGYNVLPPFSMSSSEVSAPHRRERVFIMAIDPRRAKHLASGLGPIAPPIATVWPAARGRRQRPGEPPRTIEKKLRVPGKRERLQSLGNAVVPDVGRRVGLALRAMIEIYASGAGGLHEHHARMIPDAARKASSRYWPTPVYRDASGARRDTARKEHWTSKPGETLTDAVWLSQKKDWNRPLNPDWVEGLMGFPPGWTNIGGA